MNVSDFFPYKVCINLDRRSDRWEKMKARFAQHDINHVVRFPALDGKTLDVPPEWKHSAGAFGCLRSHLAVIEAARKQARQSVLIFEDDAVFDPEFNSMFSDAVGEVPDTWDMILFGGLHGEATHSVSRHIVQVTHSLSTYAYAMKHTVYDRFIEVNRGARSLLDENTRALQKEFNCYCFMPHLAWVEEDYSDVKDELSNLWWLSESLILFGPQVEEMLKRTVAIVFHQCSSPLENLDFVLKYFAAKLPGVEVLVARSDDRLPTAAALSLPPSVRVINTAGCSRSHAFNLGFEMFEETKDYFLFLDSDLFLTREDIRGNLLKCRDYDFATSFSQICGLSLEESLKICANDLRWNAGGDRRTKTHVCESACLFTKRGLRMIGGWENADDRSAALTSDKTRRLLKVYESPNPARLLFSGSNEKKATQA